MTKERVNQIVTDVKASIIVDEAPEFKAIFDEIDAALAVKNGKIERNRQEKAAAQMAFEKVIMAHLEECLPLLQKYAKSWGWIDDSRHRYDIVLPKPQSYSSDRLIIRPVTKEEYLQNEGITLQYFKGLRYEGSGTSLSGYKDNTPLKVALVNAIKYSLDIK